MKGIVQLCMLDLRELNYVIRETELSLLTPLNISQGYSFESKFLSKNLKVLLKKKLFQ